MKTYTTELSGGYGDNRYTDLIYAGEHYETAKMLGITAPFQDAYNNWATVKTWENGAIIATEELDR